jgi:MFS family permease
MVVALAPALGPVVGGVLLHWLPWEWLFLINLPIGAVGLLLGLRMVPRGARTETAPLDWAAVALITVGLPLVLYGLTVFGSAGTNIASAMIPVVLGALALVAFVLRTLRGRNPLLDLGLYRNRRYVLASGGAGFGGALMFGSALVFPLYFEDRYHDPALNAGIRLLALGLGTGAIVPVAGRLTDRYGGGIVSTVGAVCALATTTPFAFLGAGANPVLVETLLALFGVAVGLTAVPPAIAAFKAVRPEQLPDATTQVNIVQRVGGAVGGALFTVVLSDGLAKGQAHAFRLTFVWLIGSAAITLVFSLLLHISRRTAQPAVD